MAARREQQKHRSKTNGTNHRASLSSLQRSKIRLHLKLACESACVARTNACRSRTPVAIQPIIFAKFVVSLMRLMVNTGVNGCDVFWAVGSFVRPRTARRA